VHVYNFGTFVSINSMGTRLISPLFAEGIGMALSALRGNLLRAVLTALIIAIGIMALVGMLTSTTAMESAITGQFSTMGATTFTLQSGGMNIRLGGGRRVEEKPQPQIPLYQALAFQQRFTYPGSTVSVSDVLSGTATVSLGSLKTNPNVQVVGVDNGYLMTTGLTINEGRPFSATERNEGKSVAWLGFDVATKLFPEGGALGQSIRVQGRPFLVVGVLAPKGNSAFMAQDQAVLVPVRAGHRLFGTPSSSYAVQVMAPSPEELDQCLQASMAQFRALRGLRPGEENNFNVRRSDAISAILIEQLSSVSVAAAVIGAITLLGASISLMNIMLVSVTERTREIGTRKALGATRSAIALQFLLEAILVSLLGGLVGTVLGILVGNGLSSAMGGVFILPWNWIGLAFGVCLVVGVAAGFYPARKAAALDPIEALRYE
jgi:putative ABC transport system permease protein